MNKIKYTFSSLFVLLVITLFFACKKTPDMPPVRTTAIGGTLTIAQLRNLFVGTNIKFTQDVSLYATVTMTDNYKTLYVRDNTGSISLKQLTAHGIYEGDSLRINLKGSTLDLSGTLSSLQIDSVDVSPSPTNKVVKIAVGKEHSPINVSIAQLVASVTTATFVTSFGNVYLPLSPFDGELVQVNDVQFGPTDIGLYFPLVPASVYANHTLYDCGAMNSLNFSLYTGTADFINQQVPNTKSGYITGAITFYNGALQLTPRSFADVKLTLPRCGVDTLTQNFGNCISSSNFATALPGWYDLAQVGNLIWTGNGAVAPNGYPSASNYQGQTRNVMWLISPPIQNSTSKNLNFQLAVTPFSSPTKPRQLSVWVSTDFNGLNLTSATPATWTEITPLFSNLWNWTPPGTSSFYNANATPAMLNSSSIANNPLPGYSGTFYIGFKYIGNSVTTDSTQTFAIDNFILKD